MNVSLKENWMWLLYSLLFGSLIIYRADSIFNPHGLQFTYYTTLISMCASHIILPMSYIFALAALTLNTFIVIFIIFYAFRWNVFSKNFTLLILSVKIPTDLFGHSFEWVTIKALYHHSPSLAWNQGLTLFFWILPSYIALIDYLIRTMKSQKTISIARP